VPESIESREAKHGSKMIEVKVRFWTNDLAERKDRIIPKHAWTKIKNPAYWCRWSEVGQLQQRRERASVAALQS
jgi:hypothetical protein